MTGFNQQRQQVEQQTNIGRIEHVENLFTINPPQEPVIPWEQHALPPFFQGRDKLVAKAAAALQPGARVTLYGMGGIGKTAVSAAVVSQLSQDGQLEQRFPDGVIFHSFYERPSVDQCLSHALAQSLAIEWRGDLDGAARAVFGRKRLLLMLDGAEEADDLPRLVELSGSQCGVLITSRRRADSFGPRFQVKRLGKADAQKLLAHWSAGGAGDKATRRAVCELVGNLPLAIRLAGKQIADRGLTGVEMRDRLQAAGLSELDYGRRRDQSLPVLLRESMQQVSRIAQDALAAAGRLALEPFTVEAVAAALEIELRAAQDALGELFNYGLLERPSERYLVAHPLVHGYAAQMALDERQFGRLQFYFARLFEQESRRGAAGFARLDPERPHVMRLIRLAAESEAWEAVDNLVRAVEDYLDYQGFSVERIDVLQTGVRAARARGGRHAEAVYLGNLGLAFAAQGKVEPAIERYREAQSIFQELQDGSGEATSLYNLGNTYRNLGQVQRSVDYYRQALNLARKIEDRRAEGAVLGSLGSAYRKLGQVQLAIEQYERALSIAHEIGDRRAAGTQLNNLGNAYHALGQVQQAVAHYEQALDIARELGDRRGEGVRLGNLGSVYHALGQVQRSIEHYQQALEIARAVGDRRGEAERLANLGLAYRDLQQSNRARTCLQAAQVIFEEIGDPRADRVRQHLAAMEDTDEG